MGKTVMVVLLIAVVGIGAFVLSGADIPLRSGTGGQATIGDLTETQTMTQEGGQSYNGDLTATFSLTDSSDPVLPYELENDLVIICYERIGDNVRNWEVLGKGDDSSTEKTIIPIRKTTSVDAGVTEMWCEFTPETGGQALYFDTAGTIQANQRIDTCIYDDPNLDQTNDFVCRVNLLDVSPADPNNLPTLNIRLKVYEDATTANLNVATSILNIGTGNVDNRIKWTMNFVTTSTQNDAGAKALSQIIIAINGTNGDDTLWDAGGSMIEVPNGATIQRIKLTQMQDIPLATELQYRWDYDQTTGQRDVASANLIVVANGGDPEVDIPVIIKTRFGVVADTLCVELDLEYVDSFNVFTNTKDSAELVGDTTNPVECTL